MMKIMIILFMVPALALTACSGASGGKTDTGTADSDTGAIVGADEDGKKPLPDVKSESDSDFAISDEISDNANDEIVNDEIADIQTDNIVNDEAGDTATVNDDTTENTTVNDEALDEETADNLPDTTPDEVADNIDNTPDTDSAVPWAQQDSDGDGLINGVEGTGDTDGDGTPDYLDTDSDGDGIPDAVEGDTDFDSDGIPNYRDTDSDNDGITDSVEAGADKANPADSDGDGYSNFVDFDSDNDGLSDKKENAIGTDPKKADTDNDGQDDIAEVAYGSDPLDDTSKIPESDFYVILPYNKTDADIRYLDFSTKIVKTDILFIVDLSGSMSDEISNLKAGITGTIIPGVKNDIPDASFGLATFDDIRGSNGDTIYKLELPVTDSTVTVQNAVNGLTRLSNYGQEPHHEALYQAATGAGFNGKFDYLYNSPPYQVPGTFYPQIPVPDCTGKLGSRMGACFRDGAMPIFIMMSDEAFTNIWRTDWFTWYSSPYDAAHTRQQAIDAMNTIKAKFIGLNSFVSLGWNFSPETDFKAVATGTGSVDSLGDPFYYDIGGTGSNISTQIVDAVIALTHNVKLNVVNTLMQKDIQTQYPAVDTTQFIKSVVPYAPAPGNGYVSKDASSFYIVNPGTKVTFEVTFKNDFFEPDTTEATLFKAYIHVYGEGTLLDTREVYIIVPGKQETGGSE